MLDNFGAIFMKKITFKSLPPVGMKLFMTSQGGQLQQKLNKSDSYFKKLQHFLSQEAGFCQ